MMSQASPDLESELSGTLEELQGRCGAPKALAYFEALARTYFCFGGSPGRNEVLIFGSSFPEELLWANRMVPHWVVGGGLASGGAVDGRVPRDADAVSRSMFGYIEAYLARSGRDIPIIVPMTGDNHRKIAYLLQNDGRRVIPLDIAPETEGSKRSAFLTGQLSGIMADLTFAWHLPGQAKKLARAIQTVRQARAAALALVTDLGPEISGMLKMFLLNTYFYADDLTEWSDRLRQLTRELAGEPSSGGETARRPGVLIVGSPVLFPNYKVPLLLESAGLAILGACDCVAGRVLAAGAEPAGTGRDALLDGLIRQAYDNDCTGAFVCNQALADQTSRLLDRLDVRGVVFHIIKGQIEYDFELERMEPLFAARRLPVFRLETDYHDNDMEQLRIRLEAFAELLTQDGERS